MKQKLLLLALILGLVSVACQQNVSARDVVKEAAVAAEVPQAEVPQAEVPQAEVPQAEVPQAVVQPVEVISVQNKLLLKTTVPKVDNRVKVVAETAVSAPALSEKAVVPTQDDDTAIHTVEEGEWIYEIARCYGTSPQAIINANFPQYYHYGYWYYGYWHYGYGHAYNANYIYPEQTLTIPDVGSVSEPYGPPCVRKHEDTYQHPMGTPGTYIHTVEQGDWIYELARCYGTTAKHIMRANALYYPDYIKPGQLLVIPLAGSDGDVDGPDCIDLYTVASGDTWASIAAAHDTTEAILMRANPGPLTVGKRIWVPVH